MGDDSESSSVRELIESVESKVARCALRCATTQLRQIVGAAFVKPPEGCHWALHPMEFDYNQETGRVEISISADLRLH